LTRSDRPGGGAVRRNPRTFRAAHWLALAASPTFAIMALLNSVLGGGATEMLCSAAHASPLSGMTAMYLLMSLFHLSPWLKRTWPVERGRPPER
jgi:hypothetical protein